MATQKLYWKLAIRSGVFILAFVVLDWALGTLLHVFYFKQQSGLQYRTTYALEQTKADVVFFGASRCNHHYDPLIFENNLKLTSYNAGRDGNGLPYHYAVLTSILQRYTPKVIVLDLLAGDFVEYNESYERLSALLPYYATHPEIRPVVQMKSPYERIKLLSHIYPFNSLLLTIAAGNVSHAGKHSEDINGYLPLTTVWQKPLGELPEADVLRHIDTRKVKLFESFLAACTRRNVRLYVMVSPYYLTFDNRTDPTLTLARQLTKQYNVPLLDYSQDQFYLNSPKYFADPTHLNVAGSTHYSTMLAQLLKERLLARDNIRKDLGRPKTSAKLNRQAKQSTSRRLNRHTAV